MRDATKHRPNKAMPCKMIRHASTSKRFSLLAAMAMVPFHLVVTLGITIKNTQSFRGSSVDSQYVFLQKFPLQGSDGLFFHTEVLVCPRNGFSSDDQQMLDEKIKSLQDFVEIDEGWWSDKTYKCIELGYGGAYCSDECCGVPHGGDQLAYPLNAHRAMISNADASQKALYLYGTGALDGDAAYHHACDHKCWSNWAGTDYNPLTNNCNTFTSTILSCVYDLSQKKPHLGPSDMVTVKCDCSSDEEPNSTTGLEPEAMTE